MLDALWFGFIVMVIGMLVVFVGLFVLIMCIQLMSKAALSLEQKKAQAAG